MSPKTEILFLRTLKLYLKKNTDQFSGAENIAESIKICEEIDSLVKSLTAWMEYDEKIARDVCKWGEA